MAKDESTRSREKRERKLAKGLVPYSGWCKESHKPLIKETERRLAKDDSFEAAFKQVFGVDG